jgi:hypothetical protein
MRLETGLEPTMVVEDDVLPSKYAVLSPIGEVPAVVPNVSPYGQTPLLLRRMEGAAQVDQRWC